MASLDKIEMKSLLEMLGQDLRACVNGENEFWGKDEYESMLIVFEEIESRCKGKFRSME